MRAESTSSADVEKVISTFDQRLKGSKRAVEIHIPCVMDDNIDCVEQSVVCGIRKAEVILPEYCMHKFNPIIVQMPNSQASLVVALHLLLLSTLRSVETIDLRY